MTDDFQRGLITGLAMQPLQVTTEHATPDASTSSGGEVITGSWAVVIGNPVIIGEVLTIQVNSEVT